LANILVQKIARLAATRHADINFKHLLPRQLAQALPDLRETRLVLLLCGISTPFFANLFPIPLNLRTIGGKHRPAFFSGLFGSCSQNTDEPLVENKERAGRRRVGGAQVPHNVMALSAGVFPASTQEGDMIMHRGTIRPVSLTISTDNFVCHCEGIGWIVIEGKGAKECGCRIRAKTIRKLERIPPEYERLRIESVAPDLKRHPRQAFVWQTVKKHPDLCYLLCGQPGAGKSAVLWALYARAAEQNRPAVAMSLSELVEDFRRAETASYGDEYLPELHPSRLQNRSDRWFIGIDDFHIGRPTRFAGEMIYRLLDAAYSYRHQLVITSQLDRRKLERHWAEAGASYGQAIMRRVLEIDGAMYLTLFETDGAYEKYRD